MHTFETVQTDWLVKSVAARGVYSTRAVLNRKLAEYKRTGAAYKARGLILVLNHHPVIARPAAVATPVAMVPAAPKAAAKVKRLTKAQKAAAAASRALVVETQQFELAF